METRATVEQPDSGAGKAAWRAWARAVRSAVPAPEREAAGRAVAEHLGAWRPFAAAKVVGVYLAFGRELGLAEVIRLTREAGKTVVAPRAHELPEPHLTLHELRQGDTLALHRLGQPEPPEDAPRIAPSEVDVLLVPGLVFDERGYRLGYGLGYYDRLLPLLAGGTPTVGVALSALLVPQLPTEEHDARLTHVVTERGLFETL